mgnify:CR=1 FL=1
MTPAKLFKLATLIEKNEQKAAFISFFLVFILMAAYYILRPVRDAMASDWTNTEISILWNIQFFLSLTFIALYGVIISRIKFRYLVPTIYGFFALSFFCFHFGSGLINDEVLGKGKGSRIALAEQNAAEQALVKLKEFFN